MKCGSVNCDHAAWFKVFWPGQTIDMCVDCAERAEKIAEAMGFKLHVVVILPASMLRGLS